MMIIMILLVAFLGIEFFHNLSLKKQICTVERQNENLMKLINASTEKDGRKDEKTETQTEREVENQNQQLEFENCCYDVEKIQEEKHEDVTTDKPQDVAQTIEANEQQPEVEDLLWDKEDEQTEKFNKEKEKKNTLLLTTGTILVVLSAISALSTAIPTWIKTGIMLLMIGMFFGAEKLARDIFKLKKAEKTFFFTAMFYIPICFVAISSFGLFGQWLSIHGAGKYIYLFVTWLAISAVYYLGWQKRGSKILMYGSVIAQAIAMTSACLAFKNNIYVALIGLLIYNLLLMLFGKSKAFEKIYSITPTAIGILILYLTNARNIDVVVALLILMVNFFVLQFKKDTRFNAYMLNISVMAFGAYVICYKNFMMASTTTQLLFVMYILSVFVIEKVLYYINENRNIDSSGNVVMLASLGLSYLFSPIDQTLLANAYILGLVAGLLLSVIYFTTHSKRAMGIAGGLSPFCFIIAMLHFVSQFMASNHAYAIFALLLLLKPILSKKFLTSEKMATLKSGLVYATNISGIAILMWGFLLKNAFFMENIQYVISVLALCAYNVMFESGFKKTFKYGGYLTMIMALFSIGTNYLPRVLFSINWEIPIAVIAIILLEMKFRILKDKFSEWFIIALQVISFAVMGYTDGISSIIGGIVFASAIILLNYYRKKGSLYNLPAIAMAMCPIFLTEQYGGLALGLMFLATVLTTFMSVKDKKLGVYTLLSAAYLISTLANVQFALINYTIFSVWCAVHIYFVENEKSKDILRILAYISLTSIYYDLIKGMILSQYTVFSLLGATTFMIVATRKVLTKYIGDSATVKMEYVSLSLIYLLAMFTYTSLLDGALFIIMICMIGFVGYIKGYSPLFITAIFAVVVNVVVLTERYLVGLPWWLYILALGVFCIAVAIKNELSEKAHTDKISYGSFFKKLVDICERKNKE